MNDKIVLLDSNSLLNRAFYALPPLINKDGIYTNAVYGYVNMLLKIIEIAKPKYIVAVFDLKAPTFRHIRYEQYKAQRKGMPDELAAQLPIIKNLLSLMNISIVTKEGFEADDIIGTFAKKFDTPTIIVTGDKDSLQLVDDTTTVWFTKKGIKEIVEYTPERLLEDGLTPSQVIDLKALMGDASDNIPGVRGVGEVTAKSLLATYKNLDNVYANIDEIKGKLKEKLVEDKEMAYLSYELATIDTKVPLDNKIEEFVFDANFSQETKKYMLELGFKTIVDRLEFITTESDSKNTPKIEQTLKIVENVEQLDTLIKEIEQNKKLSIIFDENIKIAYNSEVEFSVKIANNLFEEGLTFEVVAGKLKGVLECVEVQKYIFDYKALKHYLTQFDITLNGLKEDILIKAYLIDSTMTYKTYKDILAVYGLDETYCASALLHLCEQLNEELDKFDLQNLYYNIELPLVEILFNMEQNGFKIDKIAMKELGDKFKLIMAKLSEEITALAGISFNINSPKQLANVLFENLGLQSGKKNKTGFSTNIDVLESLKDQHPIVPLILKYREYFKLTSTYIDGMYGLLDSNDKIHTIFKQTITATGRLSSTEPNLQNIPVRKSLGKEIRRLFIASEGNTLVCADYSQIELRLLASMSGDDNLINAYKNDEDIHRKTASEVFNVPLNMVTDNMRRSAKAVNFGIIYGISSYGLSSDLMISRREAEEYIAKYFATYPKTKEYMDENVKFATENGYVKTLSGRIRKIPEITNSNFNIRNFGKRIAMNMPLQGTASDIIKIAMIKLDNALKENKLNAKLIMQIHDELIVDTPNNEVEIVKTLLKKSMETAMSLKVELISEVSVGDNWLETK
ncbi:MAG: DNA polymerase I [Clostridia bacterium]